MGFIDAIFGGLGSFVIRGFNTAHQLARNYVAKLVDEALRERGVEKQPASNPTSVNVHVYNVQNYIKNNDLEQTEIEKKRAHDGSLNLSDREKLEELKKAGKIQEIARVKKEKYNDKAFKFFQTALGLMKTGILPTLIVSDENKSELVITELNTRKQSFIHLYMTGKYSQAKIADMMGIHLNTVKNYLKDPLVQQAIEEMQKEQHKFVEIGLKSMTEKAMNRLCELMDSPLDAIALQAVKDVLDRGGHKTRNEIKIDKTVRTFEQKMADIIDLSIDDYEVLNDE
jgi:predicted transcriptional regulator